MNDLIGPDDVARLAAVLGAPAGAALRGAADGLEPLSLRQRTDRVAEALLVDVADLRGVVRGRLDDPRLDGWVLWPVGEAIVTDALADGSAAAFDDALDLLRRLTVRLSSEFAIRRLLAADLDRCLAAARAWCDDPDPRVRRLASEGFRPLLPWAVRVPAVTARPGASAATLHALHDDPDEVVRRSVANHVNDISRLDPALAVEVVGAWSRETAAGDRSVRHALRTLVKAADPGALALLGVVQVSVAVGPIQFDQEVVRLPGRLEIAADLTNTDSAPAHLVVDYVVHYVKASGRTAPKVFKLTTLDLPAGATARVRTGHALHQMTTRVHHPGVHAVELQVNGTRHGRAEFTVEV